LKLRYSKLRRYFPKFCELPFKAEAGGEAIYGGLLQLVNLNTKLKDDNHDLLSNFLSGPQKALLINEKGVIDRAYSEIFFALQMKESIRSGQLHLPDSKKNISFLNMIYDPSDWVKEKDQHYDSLSLPQSPSAITTKLSDEYTNVIDRFVKNLPVNKFCSVIDGSLELGRMDATPSDVDKTKALLETTLPKVRIEDILLFANKKCNFLNEFKPPPGYEVKSSDKINKILMAAIIAKGTNLGVTAMGNSAKGISVDELSNASNIYIRDATIRLANAKIVDCHHNMKITKTWGQGSSSSSDGQRFGVQKSSLLATFYPRYFGYYDRAVTVYTHTSDQYSVFHTDVISCSSREAIYVLDGLLENTTAIRSHTHFTDTHGYTEHIFALCYLLGFSFMPRIKDLTDQRIYKINQETKYEPDIEKLFSGTIDFKIIEEQWDSIVRVVASLKNRNTKASLIVNRLSRATPSDRLAKAITQLGRLIKTIFIFQYLDDEDLRRRIQNQLNRGEARHQLAKHLFFANQGEFRNGDYEEMMHKASCLSLLSNAVLLANTCAIQALKRTHPESKVLLKKSDLARISPLLFRRVISNGTYHFK
jgi:TnpA family transposase